MRPWTYFTCKVRNINILLLLLHYFTILMYLWYPQFKQISTVLHGYYMYRNNLKTTHQYMQFTAVYLVRQSRTFKWTCSSIEYFFFHVVFQFIFNLCFVYSICIQHIWYLFKNVFMDFYFKDFNKTNGRNLFKITAIIDWPIVS